MAFVETADDLTIFFADGDSATIDGETVKGHFENEHDPVNAGGMVEFSIQSATFTCKTSDVTGIAEGSLITINGSSYAVTDLQPDGTGVTMLILEAQ